MKFIFIKLFLWKYLSKQRFIRHRHRHQKQGSIQLNRFAHEYIRGITILQLENEKNLFLPFRYIYQISAHVMTSVFAK